MKDPKRAQGPIRGAEGRSPLKWGEIGPQAPRQNGSLLGPFGGSWPAPCRQQGVQERALEKEPQHRAHVGDFGVIWDSFGGSWPPKCATRGSKALTTWLWRGLPRRTPKMHHFGTHLGEAQVSSRLGESMIFTVSPSSLSDPILESFGLHFGTRWAQYARPGEPRKARRAYKRESQNPLVSGGRQGGWLLAWGALEPQCPGA